MSPRLSRLSELGDIGDCFRLHLCWTAVSRLLGAGLLLWCAPDYGRQSSQLVPASLAETVFHISVAYLYRRTHHRIALRMILLWVVAAIVFAIYLWPACVYADTIDKGRHKGYIKFPLIIYVFWLWPTMWLMPRSWVEWILFS